MAILHLWFSEIVNKHMLAVFMQAADASGIEGYQPIIYTL